MVRIPIHTKDLIDKYNATIEHYKKMELVPSDNQICLDLNISMKQLNYIKKYAEFKFLSLNKPIDAENQTIELGDVILDSMDYENDFLSKDSNQSFLADLKTLLESLDYYVLYY